MLLWDGVLVIDAASVFVGVMEVVLRPHSTHVCGARTCMEARERLRASSDPPDFSLVVVDPRLPDGDGLDAIEAACTESRARPRILVVTARPSAELDRRASAIGAIDVLTKPVAFRDIARAWKQSQGIDWKPLPRARRGVLGIAHLMDGPPGTFPLFSWQIHDLSTTGAFLETKGPVPVGTELFLALDLDGARVEVHAVVVRLQEPSWAHVAGVGVVFTRLDERSKRELWDHVSRRTAGAD